MDLTVNEKSLRNIPHFGFMEESHSNPFEYAEVRYDHLHLLLYPGVK